LRVYTGTLRQGEKYTNVRNGRRERVGRVLRMHADQREPLDEAKAGDIVAVIGLRDTFTGDTLCEKAHPVMYEAIVFPETVISMSIEPKFSADRDKLAEVVGKVMREDPTFIVHTDDQTGQMIINGMGELHLEVVCHRIQNEFKVPVHVGRPKVAYKQTLTQSRDVEARHIKQTGGAGQFAVVHVRYSIDPEIDGVCFENKVVGGSVPKEFIRSVETGILNAAKGGGQLGYPFVKVHAELYDGQSHDVDSSTIAFEAAGALSFRFASENNFTLLEPIMKIEVESPEDNTGDVIADLASRRGTVEEMITKPGSITSVRGKVPLAEMFKYSNSLRSMTQGRGHYSMEPDSYAPMPSQIAEKILAEH
jgi:elongation factor G